MAFASYTSSDLGTSLRNTLSELGNWTKNEEIQVVYKLYRNNGRLCDKNVEPPSNLKRKHNSNSILKCSIFGFHMIS